MSDADSLKQHPKVVRLPGGETPGSPGRPPRDRSADERVGRELATLGDAWTVLHGADLGPVSDVGQIVIGPGGVFSLTAKWLPPRAKVTVTPRRLVVDGHSCAYYEEAVGSASHVADRLQAAAGRPIPVVAVVVLSGVDPEGVRVVQQPADLTVLLQTELCRWLEWQQPRLDVESAARLARAASRPATWAPAKKVVVLDAPAPDAGAATGGQGTGDSSRVHVARNRP